MKKTRIKLILEIKITLGDSKISLTYSPATLKLNKGSPGSLSNEVLYEVLSQRTSEIQAVKLLAIQVYLIK